MRLNSTSVLTTTPEYVEIKAATPLGISIIHRINEICFGLMNDDGLQRFDLGPGARVLLCHADVYCLLLLTSH